MSTKKTFIKATFYLLITFGFTLLFTSCKKEKEKTIGTLYLSKEKPSPGDIIDIRYVLPKKHETVKAAYLYFKKTKSQPEDFDYTITDGVLNGELKIPTEATAISLFFITQDGNNKYNIGSDKGHLSYIFPLYNNDNELIPGAQSSIAQRFLRYGKEIDSCLTLMKNDLEKNPHLKTEWNPIYLKHLYSQNKDEGKKLIHKQIKILENKKELNQEEYSTLFTLFNTLKYNIKADSISNIATKKFPKGIIIKNKLTNAFEQEDNLENRIEIYNKYAVTLDRDEYQKDTYKNYMLMRIASEYIPKQDITSFIYHTDQITNILMKADLYNDMAYKLSNNKKLAYAAKLCETSLNILPTIDSKDVKRLVTASKYNEWIKKSIKNSTSIYADIHFKQGNITEAIKYKEKVIGNGNDEEINEKFIEYLLADNRYKEIQKVASHFIEMGTATSKIKAFYKTAFLKNKGTISQYEAYIKNIDKEIRRKELVAYRKKMVNEIAPDFTLKNLDGEKVALSSLKGKTIILDFWANWCSPCKSAFPGMQIAVDKYKDNPDVVFLFINTYEKDAMEKRIQKTKDYLELKKYSFEVLLDPKIENGYDVAKKYKVEALPTKIIIGPDGNIKFRPSVYKQITPLKMLEEFEIMIKLTQS